MQLKKITWRVLPYVGNPCKLCGEKEAVWFATMQINPAGTITLPLCGECVQEQITVPETEIIERILT